MKQPHRQIIARERPSTADWHYVDIDVNAQAFDPARDGHKGDNVIERLEQALPP